MPGAASEATPPTEPAPSFVRMINSGERRVGLMKAAVEAVEYRPSVLDAHAPLVGWYARFGSAVVGPVFLEAPSGRHGMCAVDAALLDQVLRESGDDDGGLDAPAQ